MNIANVINCLKESLSYYRKNRFNVAAMKVMLECLNDICQNDFDGEGNDAKLPSYSVNQKFRDHYRENKLSFIVLQVPLICKKRVVFDEKVFPFRLAEGNQNLSVISFPQYHSDEIYFSEILLCDERLNLNRETFYSNLLFSELDLTEWLSSGKLFAVCRNEDYYVTPQMFIKYIIKKYETHKKLEARERAIDEFSTELVVGEMTFDVFMIEYISQLLIDKLETDDRRVTYKTKFVRYMDLEYCNQFFNDGLLRLTNIRVFRNYTNEYQGDQNEGIYSKRSTFINNYRMRVKAEYCGNAYILCGTTNDTEELQNIFNASAGIVISNIPAFVDDILSSNPEIQVLLTNKCNYFNEESYVESMVKKGVKLGEEGQLLFKKSIVEKEIGRCFGLDDLFTKSGEYEYQQEYRFIVELPFDEDFASIRVNNQKQHSHIVIFNK